MPRYSEEFKTEALQLLERNHGNIHATSKQLGIAWKTLLKWSERASGKNVVVGSAEEEIQRLRKKLRQAELEREILKKAVAFFAKDKELRFQFIEREKAHYKVRMLCRVLHVSRSGYYAWKQRGPSLREVQTRRMVKRMREVHRTRKKCCGSPRLTRELKAEGFRVGENRVARIMREHGIVAHRPRS